MTEWNAKDGEAQVIRIRHQRDLLRAAADRLLVVLGVAPPGAPIDGPSCLLLLDAAAGRMTIELARLRQANDRLVAANTLMEQQADQMQALTDLIGQKASAIGGLVEEAQKLREALGGLLAICLTAAPGAFRNGNTDQSGSSDEGEYWAGQAIDRARALIPGFEPAAMPVERAKGCDVQQALDEMFEAMARQHGIPVAHLKGDLDTLSPKEPG